MKDRRNCDENESYRHSKKPKESIGIFRIVLNKSYLILRQRVIPGYIRILPPSHKWVHLEVDAFRSRK